VKSFHANLGTIRRIMSASHLFSAERKGSAFEAAFDEDVGSPLTRQSKFYRFYRRAEKVTTSILLGLDPEVAHTIGIGLLKLGGLRPKCLIAEEGSLSTKVLGYDFPNPIGLAAGVDKNASAVAGALKTGFGFTEVGTLTPKKQHGNRRPRVFRIPEHHAVINRFGFNNCGYATAFRKLKRTRISGILGVNLGANRDSPDRIDDYVRGIYTFADVASYFTINVSSPNTPGLRDLQTERPLNELLGRVLEARDTLSERNGKRPVLLKISPDLTPRDLDDLVLTARHRGVDGIIVSNTTEARPANLGLPHEGGLSGPPLFRLSTRVLAEVYLRAEGAFPLVGVGGIDSAEAAWQKMRAGASLIQLNTALYYKSLGLIDDIKVGLIERLTTGHHLSLADIVGVDAAQWTCEPWPQNF
jgi:dihydroorotate dehydrogenase